MALQKILIRGKKYILKGISFSKSQHHKEIQQEVFYLRTRKNNDGLGCYDFACYSPINRSEAIAVISFSENAIITDGNDIEPIEKDKGIECSIMTYQAKGNNAARWKELSAFIKENQKKWPGK